MPYFSADQLARIESLGDNCELGFVLRRLGFEAGSLFRWARARADQVCALLEQGFADIYAFDALTPSRLSMVEEARYGINWHTEMRSHIVAGRLAFISDPATRRDIHHRELQKFRYLIEKFRHRLRSGGLLLVIKANEGIAQAELERLHAALAVQAAGASFTLLQVRAAAPGVPEPVGVVTRQPSGILTGAVSALADYNTADDLDFDGWVTVLARALALAAPARPSYEAPERRPDDGLIMLNLPDLLGPDCVAAPVEDPRGGIGRLLHGDAWCRRVEDCFRLHAPPPGQPASHLRWTDIRLSGPTRFATRIHSPITDGMPVRIDIALHDADGTLLAHRHCDVSPAAPAQLLVPLPDTATGPLQLDILAQSPAPLAPGERAVVDLSLLCLERTDLAPIACVASGSDAIAA